MNQPIRKIRDILERKPSKAIQCMVDGLNKQSQRSDFEVIMVTFGLWVRKKGVCFGCAATCTIQEIAGRNLDARSIGELEFRAFALGFEPADLERFEYAIDNLREGVPQTVFSYLGIDYPDELKKHDLPRLNTTDWREGIGQYIAYANELKKSGL